MESWESQNGTTPKSDVDIIRYDLQQKSNKRSDRHCITLLLPRSPSRIGPILVTRWQMTARLGCASQLKHTPLEVSNVSGTCILHTLSLWFQLEKIWAGEWMRMYCIFLPQNSFSQCRKTRLIPSRAMIKQHTPTKRDLRKSLLCIPNIL